MIRSFDLIIFWYLNSWAGVAPFGDLIIVFCAKYLAYIFVFAFLVLLLLWRRSRQEKIRIFWVAAFSGAIARLGITELIRFFYHRPRPFMAYHGVHQLLVDNEWSFPSGHAAFFFAVAAALYLYNKKWGSIFFVAAVFMTVARVIAGIHYPSDIVGGAGIGIAVAYIVFYYCAEKLRVKKAAKI